MDLEWERPEFRRRIARPNNVDDRRQWRPRIDELLEFLPRVVCALNPRAHRARLLPRLAEARADLEWLRLDDRGRMASHDDVDELRPLALVHTYLRLGA